MGQRNRTAPLAVLASVVSVQVGQAFGKGLLDAAGPLGVASVRLAIGAALMAVLWRPAVPRTWREVRAVLALGTSIAGMNVGYLAMARLPFGVAMTLQLLGPLAVALAAARRPRELAWAGLATVSVLLFADPASLTGPSVAGLAYGLLSAAAMALFLLLSARAAAGTRGGAALTPATAWAAVVFLPLGVVESGPRLLQPTVLAIGTVVAALSVVAPYALTLVALRRLPVRVVGILLSLEPVAAGLAGLVVLGEHLSVPQWLAIAGITAASVGATWSAPQDARGTRRSRSCPGHVPTENVPARVNPHDS